MAPPLAGSSAELWAGWQASALWPFRASARSLPRAPSWAPWPASGWAGPSVALTGALVGMGIPEYEAKRYEGRIKDGGILLSVHSDTSEWTKKAKDILERSGAQDVASAGEARADFSKTDRPMPRAS